MPVNAWIEHVRKYAKDNNISYACAISKAKETYVKKEKTSAITTKQLTAMIKALDTDTVVKLFTPKKGKNKYDYSNPDRDETIKRILDVYNTQKDRQDIYNRILKRKK
jgi:Holliday junction resolvase RusA-like endonuclease